MSTELRHYGIKGMKWGVIRTPAQLGHAPKQKKKAKIQKRNLSDLSDDELRQRIARLNLEENYMNVSKRVKDAKTGPFMKFVNKGLSNLADKSLNFAIESVIDGAKKRSKEKEEKFDIDKWIGKDVKTMDPDTISKVAKWYTNAAVIEDRKNKLSGTP